MVKKKNYHKGRTSSRQFQRSPLGPEGPRPRQSLLRERTRCTNRRPGVGQTGPPVTPMRGARNLARGSGRRVGPRGHANAVSKIPAATARIDPRRRGPTEQGTVAAAARGPCPPRPRTAERGMEGNAVVPPTPLRSDTPAILRPSSAFLAMLPPVQRGFARGKKCRVPPPLCSDTLTLPWPSTAFSAMPSLDSELGHRRRATVPPPSLAAATPSLPRPSGEPPCLRPPRSGTPPLSWSSTALPP